MSFGRPTKYPKTKKKQQQLCEALIEHGKTGLSFEIFGIDETVIEIIGTHVVKSTLYEWIKDHPEFSNAKKLYTIHCQKYWEKKSNDHITHYKDGKQLNSAVWIFNMRNRFGWRDKPKDEIDERDNNINLNINVVGADAEVEKGENDADD